MKRTQNDRILQIKDHIVIVGVGIGKDFHYARAFSNRGIELGKVLRFSSRAQGFFQRIPSLAILVKKQKKPKNWIWES